MANLVAATPPTSTTTTTGYDGSDSCSSSSSCSSSRDGSSGDETVVVVVVGCASGLVAWFTLLIPCPSTSSPRNDAANANSAGVGRVLSCSKAMVWRDFADAQVRAMPDMRSVLFFPFHSHTLPCAHLPPPL